MSEDIKIENTNSEGDNPNQRREEIGQRIKSRLEKNKESDKEGDAVFHAVEPSTRYDVWWTVFLVLLLVVALGVIVYLLVYGGANQSTVTTQEKFIAYNQIKEKYDQSLVSATNELILAESSFNKEDYNNANDQAKKAADEFDRSIDYLYEIKSIDFSEYVFVSTYLQDLEDVSSTANDMSTSLSYAARSADRGQYMESAKSLIEYKSYAGDIDEIIGKIKTIKQSNQDFFAQ